MRTEKIISHTALLPSSGQTNLVPNDVVGRLGERLVPPEIHRHEKLGSRSRSRQSGALLVNSRGQEIRTKHKHLGDLFVGEADVFFAIFLPNAFDCTRGTSGNVRIHL